MANPPPPLFRTRFFLLGLVLGVGLLSWFGGRFAHHDFHPDFVRFIPQVSPEGSYYPTLDEMTAIVRARCRKDQTLVIVGGNSILLGVWQPVEDLWTKKLQDLLGDKYCVVNLAFRGAAPADCGGVVAEVLRKEYPHQIYIADEAELNGVSAIGSPAYRQAFWQAYYAGLLENVPIREQRISEYLNLVTEGRAEHTDVVISNVADSFLHFRNLWNWVGYNYWFSIPTLWGPAFPSEFVPRRSFKDTEADILAPENLPHRYSPDLDARELEIVRAAVTNDYAPGPDGKMALLQVAHDDLDRYLHEAFPPDLHARTLILVSENSPYYRRMLTDAELELNERARRETLAIWLANGYPAFIYGTDFNDDDFGDRTHLSKLGGAKLADLVAGHVREISERLGYNR